MTIGILGAGAIAQAIARRATQAEIEVRLSNSRGADSLGEIVSSLGPYAKATTREEAASQDVVIIAVTWPNIPAAVAGLPAWNGKIIIDASNPMIPPDFRTADLGGRTSSEIVSELVPGCRLVKAFNTLPPELLQDDPPTGGRRTIFLSGDFDDAKLEVSRLLDRMGFVGIDMGGLVEGGRKHGFPGGALAGQNFVRFPLT